MHFIPSFTTYHYEFSKCTVRGSEYHLRGESVRQLYPSFDLYLCLPPTGPLRCQLTQHIFYSPGVPYIRVDGDRHALARPAHRSEHELRCIGQYHGGAHGDAFEIREDRRMALHVAVRDHAGPAPRVAVQESGRRHRVSGHYMQSQLRIRIERQFERELQEDG
jgi:hypothetical protein